MQGAIPGLEQELTPEQAQEHHRTAGRCLICGLNEDLCSGASEEEFARARAFIDAYAEHAASAKGRRRGWSFATSMPDSPHEYAVRERAAAAELEMAFEWFVLLIRSRGYTGKHGRTTYTYMNVETDGIVRRYWTMGNPLSDTTIINRTPVQPDDQAKLRAANVKAKR